MIAVALSHESHFGFSLYWNSKHRQLSHLHCPVFLPKENAAHIRNYHFHREPSKYLFFPVLFYTRPLVVLLQRVKSEREKVRHKRLERTSTLKPKRHVEPSMVVTADKGLHVKAKTSVSVKNLTLCRCAHSDTSYIHHSNLLTKSVHS